MLTTLEFVSFCLCMCRQECNTALVRACWNELFILGLAQCTQIMSLSTILAAIVNHLQSSIQDGMVQLNIKSYFVLKTRDIIQ